MIVDVNFDGKKLIVIHDDSVEYLEPIKPYFYVLSKSKFFQSLLKNLELENVVDIEETGLKAIVNVGGSRYDVDPEVKVYKVYCTSPNVVPEVAKRFMNAGFKCAAFNVRYVARNTFDLDLEFFDTRPLYYGLDVNVLDRIRKLKALIIDVEVVQNRPVLCSCYVYTPFEEIKKDDVISIKLPEQFDELQKLLNQYQIIVGHNVIGFDIPILRSAGFDIDVKKKAVFDSSYLLANWSQSFWIGSARSLLDVARALKDAVGITDEELEIKIKQKGRVERMSWDELVKYNINDIVLTAKLQNVFFTFLTIISALTQIPPSVVQNITAGLVAEYYLLHDLELRGLVPEYRAVDWRVDAEKVYIYANNYYARNVAKYDVKMMYPSFVLAHKVDPTLIVDDAKVQEGVTYRVEHGVDLKIKFDLSSGIGAVWSTVNKLYFIRSYTKKLKKQNPMFESVDMAVKAIINALAYGVQGKKSGYSPFGNVAVPVKIFLGTTRVLYEVIKKLREEGIHIIYGDTDSIFVELKGQDPQEVLKKINEIMAQWGLECDFEGLYDQALILTKKTYFLIGKDVVIKGSAIKSRLKFYIPACISRRFIEIIRADPSQRRKLIKEIIDSADISELFAQPAQQLWRLIGRDVQATKREQARGKQIIYVRTPWETKPRIALKKSREYMWAMPHSAPLIQFLALQPEYTIMLSEYDPSLVIEAYYLYIPQSSKIRLPVDIFRRENARGIYLINDVPYVIAIKNVKYVIEDISGAIKEVPSGEIGEWVNNKLLVAVKGDLKVKRLNISEDVLRKIAYEIALDQINRILARED